MKSISGSTSLEAAAIATSFAGWSEGTMLLSVSARSHFAHRNPAMNFHGDLLYPEVIAAMDLFVVPTISFRLLYGLVEYYSTDMRGGARSGSVTLHDRLTRGRVMSQPISRFGVISGMIEKAENLAKDYDISREASDEYAVRSHRRAAAAWKEGKFNDELVPVSVPQRKGPPKIFGHDKGYRSDASMEMLGALRPIEKDGVVTPGNASQQNDAAS